MMKVKSICRCDEENGPHGGHSSGCPLMRDAYDAFVRWNTKPQTAEEPIAP